jgi:Putative peptidoglycan binding domain
MRISIAKGIPVGLLMLAVPAFASVHPKTGSSQQHGHASVKEASVKHSKSSHLRASHEEKAPATMPSERASEIQTALIKQGYLAGEPSGRWDEQTISAMQKMQGENGWQTKITPDSRALIKLGLGPTDPNAAPIPGTDVSSETSRNSAQDMAQAHQ